MNTSPLPHAEPRIPDNLPKHRLSVVVPMYNEAENVEPLLERIHLALGPYPWPWEVVLVDDGSSDATPAELTRCARQRPGAGDRQEGPQVVPAPLGFVCIHAMKACADCRFQSMRARLPLARRWSTIPAPPPTRSTPK